MSQGSLLSRIDDGDAVLGTSAHLSDPAVVELIALAGFDWVSLTLENSVLTAETLEAMQRAADLHDLPTLLHVGSLADPRILPLMHAGVGGLVLQQAQSAADAEALVRMTRFPPLGARAAHSGVRSDRYGAEPYGEFMSAANETFVTALAIEDLEGVAAAEEMLSIDGISVVFVGLFDLSHSVGAPNDLGDQRVMEALSHVREIAEAKGVPLGLPSYAHTVAELRELGARLVISPGNELAFIRRALEAHVAGARAEL